MGLWYTILALVNLIAGGFLAAATYGFDAQTTSDLGLAVSCGVLVFGFAMGIIGYGTSKTGERIGLGLLGWATAALAGWTIVATQVFDPQTAQWLVFGSGMGHIALSVAGIITHEATAKR